MKPNRDLYRKSREGVEPPQEPERKNPDFWTLDGVYYKGAIQKVDLMSKLLDNGERQDIVGWAAKYFIAINNNGFHAPDLPLFYSILRSLCEEDNQEARKFIRESQITNPLATLSKVQYRPGKREAISHNYGTADSYEVEASFSEPPHNPWVTYSPLFGTPESKDEIRKVFRWLNGNLNLESFTIKPDTKVDRVIGVYIEPETDNVLVDSLFNMKSTFQSLGVRLHADMRGSQ